MAVTLADVGYNLARAYGYQGTRAEWDDYNESLRERKRLLERQGAAVRFRRARRAHGVRKAATRWQRGTRRPRSIESALQDPRIRGQLATRPQ